MSINNESITMHMYYVLCRVTADLNLEYPDIAGIIMLSNMIFLNFGKIQWNFVM
jgi:hypothetical protein